MDDDIREWGGYYEQPRHIHLEQSRLLGLQLRPSAVDRDVKPFLTHHQHQHQHQHRGDPPIMVNNGGYHHRGYGVSEPQPSMDFINDGWMNHRENKLLHGLPRNPNFSHFSETSNSHQQFHMPPQPPPQSHDAPNDDRFFQMEEPVIKKDAPLKKRLTPKSPKVKKPKKPKDETLTSIQRSKPPKHQNAGVIIHGIDLSGIPTPVCSCTGVAQQCYRWGCGGWQSACCTTSISMYPLPMSTKRRGARIAGRKMSQGAFKKVLEKLMGEGYNLSNPIDLRSHWAKHGTNKFVTIR